MQRVGRLKGRRPWSQREVFRVRGLDLGVFMGKAVEEKEYCDEPIILPGQTPLFLPKSEAKFWLGGGRAEVLHAGGTGITCHRAALAGVG